VAFQLVEHVGSPHCSRPCWSVETIVGGIPVPVRSKVPRIGCPDGQQARTINQPRPSQKVKGEDIAVFVGCLLEPKLCQTFFAREVQELHGSVFRGAKYSGQEGPIDIIVQMVWVHVGWECAHPVVQCPAFDR
jgi:hypothetical protein